MIKKHISVFAKYAAYFGIAVLFFASLDVFASVAPAAPNFEAFSTRLREAFLHANTVSVNAVTRTCVAAASIQLALSFRKEILKGSDIQQNLHVLLTVAIWFGGAIWLLKPAQQQQLLSWFDGYVQYAAQLSGAEGTFDAWGMVLRGVGLISTLNKAFFAALDKANMLEVVQSILPAMMLLVTDIIILVIFVGLAINIFMCTIEMYFILALAPFLFALIPLSAFREQGLAPIRGILTLGMRIILIGIIAGLCTSVASETAEAYNGLEDMTLFFDALWLPDCMLMMLAAAGLYSNKIAANIMSGSSSLSGSDAVSSVSAGAGAASSAVNMASGATSAALGGTKSLIKGAMGAANAIGSMSDKLSSVGIGAGDTGKSSGGGESSSSGAPKGVGHSASGTPMGATVPTPSPSAQAAAAQSGGGNTSTAGNASTAGVSGRGNSDVPTADQLTRALEKINKNQKEGGLQQARRGLDGLNQAIGAGNPGQAGVGFNLNLHHHDN